MTSDRLSTNKDPIKTSIYWSHEFRVESGDNELAIDTFILSLTVNHIWVIFKKIFFLFCIWDKLVGFFHNRVCVLNILLVSWRVFSSRNFA